MIFNKISSYVDKHPYFYTLLLTVLIFFILNLFSFFYIKLSVNSDELDTLYQGLVSIHGKENAVDYNKVMIEQSVPVTYEPFVEYKETSRYGEFVNVSKDGIRCNSSNLDGCDLDNIDNKNEIWVFGGSTTFGYGVKDDESIPAYIAKLNPNFRILNFGAGSYYSSIERIRFENLLTQNLKPKLAIFIDGYNDFYYYNVPDKSFMSEVIEKSIKYKFYIFISDIKYHLKLEIKKLPIYRLINYKLVDKSYNSSTEFQPTATNQEILRAIKRLEINHGIISHISKAYNIKALFVKQPIATYGVGHKTSKVPDFMLNFGDHANSAKAYEMINSENYNLDCLPECELDLADFGIDQPMYVDTVHYTPEFNEAIAQKISEKIKKLL